MIRKILIAEDEFLDAKLMITYLKAQGVQNDIIHFKDGNDIVQYLSRNAPYENLVYEDPALIILDLNMPRITGFEALEIIRNSLGIHTVPILIFSSSSYNRDVIACYEKGASAYLVKPVDVQEYQRTIKAIVDFWLTVNKIEYTDKLALEQH